MSDDEGPANLASALRAILALPTVFALVVPVAAGLLDPWADDILPWGLLLVVVGGVVVARTVTDFFTIGKGTLAPWDPPRQLVTVGLFGWCRNPMYVGVLLTVLGWAISFRSPIVLGYAVALAIGFHLRVVRFEEPWAEENFPDDWPSYRATVNRWIPRPPREGAVDSAFGV